MQPPMDADAVVIALKSRTIDPALAVAQSLAACRWLKAHGAQQIYFKYCSTFDSTSRGNIGPVLEALVDELSEELAIATPAFPENGRTVYMGNLFVGDVPLHESGMRNHPLTPMTDSNLVRVLQAQSRYKVGLIPYSVVASGDSAILDHLRRLRDDGCRLAVADAICNQDLIELGAATRDCRLVSGGSGIAIGLPRNWGIEPDPISASLPNAQGKAAIISGSCSQASNAQVADFIGRGGLAFAIDGMRIATGASLVDEAVAWAWPYINAELPILIYSTASPDQVRAVQQTLGVASAGEAIEHTLAEIAARLIALGVGQMIVAGGETSGACVQRLGIGELRVGAQIDPGVPWCHTRVGDRSLHIALKSGNFGTVDFFTKALSML
jgi:uncharacterized protein YgbK (DUF1537 family)